MSEHTEGEFSVAVFYDDDTHEYVARFVGPKEAVETAKRLTENVGSRLGIITKVIITDGGDFTNFMWEYGKGVTYPLSGGAAPE